MVRQLGATRSKTPPIVNNDDVTIVTTVVVITSVSTMVMVAGSGVMVSSTVDMAETLTSNVVTGIMKVLQKYFALAEYLALRRLLRGLSALHAARGRISSCGA